MQEEFSNEFFFLIAFIHLNKKSIKCFYYIIHI